MWIKSGKSVLLFVVGLGLAMLLWFAGIALIHLPMFRLRTVQVSGAPHVSLAQVQWVIQRGVHGNLFTVDLSAVQAAFAKLPWVRSVDVRRRWPDALAVTLVEHQAVARWNEDGLVDRQGDVFYAASAQSLPQLAGPDGSSVEVMQMWQGVAKTLAPIARSPVKVSMSARGSWRVILDNGVEIALGRDDQVLSRLARWVSVYPAMLAQLNAPLVRVDLRYPQGFAVQTAPVSTTSGQGKMS